MTAGAVSESGFWGTNSNPKVSYPSGARQLLQLRNALYNAPVCQFPRPADGSQGSLSSLNKSRYEGNRPSRRVADLKSASRDTTEMFPTLGFHHGIKLPVPLMKRKHTLDESAGRARTLAWKARCCCWSR